MVKVIEERNQLQMELSELQSERDKLFEEKVCLVHLVRIVHMHYTRDSCQFPARRACGFESHPRQLLFSFDKCVVLVGVGYALALHPLIHVYTISESA